MLIIALIIILVLVLIIKGRPPMFYGDDEEVVTTTTTVTEEHEEINIVGFLDRQFEGEQAFVTDPGDQKKIWINSNDDMYEDANGRIWQLKTA